MSVPSRSPWLVIGPFLVGVALLVLLSLAGAELLSGVRALVMGEAVWAEGEKDATYLLGRYVQSGDEADYALALQALALPLGAREARLALARPQPDVARVRAGFMQSGVHAADLGLVMRLHLWFGQLGFMAETARQWTEADAGIAELQALAQRLHARLAGGPASAAERAELLLPLGDLHTRLGALERRIGATLGEGSRVVQAWAQVSALMLAGGLAAVGTAIARHILSRQAEAELALRESNTRWEMAAEGSQIGVFDWDLVRREVTLDVRAAGLYGWGVDEPVTVSTALTRDAVHPDDTAHVRVALRRAIASGQPLELRFRVEGGDGRLRHLELNGRVARPNANRMVGLLWDVTADVQAEQLRLDKEAAERANRAKTAFLSRVSHELRTPLNAVLGFAQLLQADRREPLTPGQAARVGHVLASGQHLLQLINDVLDLSIIDQGAFAVAARDLDLERLLREGTERFEPIARARQVSLHFVAPEAGLRAYADPVRLEQVFVNLVSNAIKYNRPGGHVEVRAELQGPDAWFHVRDDGPGMSAEQQAQLFQPFNRLGAEYSAVPGSGLGLVITRQLLERMGGSLSVVSEPGQGATFSVRVPRVAASAPQDAAVAPAG